MNIFLDEFANIGVIPHFETTISLARGRGVRLWLGIQSLSQLESRYGKPAAQTILTNCSSKMALSGLDVETAQYFSRSLGEKTQAAPRRTWQKRRWSLFANGTTDAVQEHSRLLMTPDEIRRIGANELLVITGNRRPMRIERTVHNASPSKAQTMPLGEAQTLPIVFAASAIGKSPPPFPAAPEVPIKKMSAKKVALKLSARKSSHIFRAWDQKSTS